MNRYTQIPAQTPWISRLLKYCLLSVLGLIYTSDAIAQTRFEWPYTDEMQTKVNTDTYWLPEMCLAAMTRVDRLMSPYTRVALDTMPLSFTLLTEKMVPEAVTLARRCSQKFTADMVNVDDAVVWLSVFLGTERIEDAKRIIARRLAAIHPDSSMRTAAVLDSFTRVYLSSRPIDLPSAESLAFRALAYDTTVFRANGRIGLSVTLFRRAYEVDDRQRALAWAERALDDFAEQTDDEKHRLINEERWVVQFLKDATRLISEEKILEKLRSGTHGYVEFRKADIAKAIRLNVDFLKGWGDKAAELVGEYWFRATTDDRGYTVGSAETAVPVLHQANLIVFFDWQHCERFDYFSCVRKLAALRRLKAEFPAVQLTFAMKTYGWFEEMKPPTPTEEAELYAKALLGFYRIPTTLVVAESPFFLLPGYDKRRINEPVPNDVSYFKGDYGSQIAFLLDKEGRIVDMPSIDRWNESYLRNLVKVLIERPVVSSP